MSKKSSAEIVCSKCGKTFETEVYTSVNSKLNPELRQSILAGNFFKNKCRSCDYENDIFYEVLYHDMDKKFMVWLVKPDDENIIFMQQNSLKLAAIFSDYKLYIARFPFQWIERIITSELGMDARIIELYKFGTKENEGFSLKTKNDFLHFQKRSKKLFGTIKFHWNYVYDDGGVEEYSKSIDVKKYKSYEKLVQSIEPNLKALKWYLIDWQFPFGMEIDDGELIQLPESSDFIELDDIKTKLPRQFLDIVEKKGKGYRLE